MYVDLILLIVAMVVVVMFFKRFSSFVFFVAIVDIFLRILTFVKDNIGLHDVSSLINKYIPESVIAIIIKYTYSIPLLCTILQWCFVFVMCVFLVYITKIFIHKKKI